MVDIVHTTDELGINSFPDPVEDFLSAASFNSPNLPDEIESQFAPSGLDEIEKAQLKDLAKTVGGDNQISSGKHIDPNYKMVPDERVVTQIIGTVTPFCNSAKR